jgi:uncharacterized protein (TIGR02246 family)
MLQIVIALSFGAATAHAQIVPGAPSTDWEREGHEYRAEILKAYNELIDDWRSAWERGDARATAEFYSDRGLLVVGDSESLEGRAAIKRYLEGVAPRTLEIRTGLRDFVTSERLAYARGTFYLEVRARDGVNNQVLTGTAVTVLVREGRRWRIRSQVFSPEPAEHQ